MVRTTRRLTALGTSLGMVAAGLLAAATTSTAEAAGAAAVPPTVRVQVADDRTVEMKQRLRPGVHRFVIRSSRAAGFQLVRPAPGYTKAEAARDVFRGLTQGRIPALRRFEDNITLVAGTGSTPRQRGVMWTDLSAGRHWAVDTVPSRPSPADFLTVRVRGADVRGTLPPSRLIRAIDGSVWATKPAAMAQEGRLSFRNDSTNNHFVAMAKLRKGKTVADWEEWLEQIQQGIDAPPPVRFGVGLDTGVVSPGEQMTIPYSLPRGNYVLTCFWPDAEMGGLPHAFMGMNREIRLR